MMRTAALGAVALVMLSGCSKATQRDATYAAACSKPMPGWRLPDGQGWHLLMHNSVSVKADGALTWNGVAITQARMLEYLRMAKAINPQPPIVLEVDPKASCAVVESVRKDIDKIYECSTSGACGEGAGDWGRSMRSG